MYFTSLVRWASIENPLTSVRRPGIVLNSGRTRLNATDSTGKVGGYSPDLPPDQPGLEIRLQNVEQEGRESEGVGVDEADHGDDE